MKKIKILSRGSKLAMIQVAEVMANLPHIKYDVIPVKTYGDMHKEISLLENSEDDLFTREIDDNLLNNGADIAIHSAKDMPFPVKKGLKLIALTRGLSRSDSLVCSNDYTLDSLPLRATIGTSSVSRREQLLQRRPDLQIVSIRGTIEERLQIVHDKLVDGIVVATCALQRLGLHQLISELQEFKTHPLQGSLGIISKEDDYLMEQLFSGPDIRRKYGRVYLTGFGPGNPEYLTVKAHKLLKSADIILYDDLTNQAYIHELKADKIYVGKRSGKHSKEQHEINELMYNHAVTGKSVVRLKGGDPFIFGRGGEEFNFLIERYIPVEIIPGITAGIAAAAELGIPLTHRDISSSVVFTAGHTIDTLQINPHATTVIYMAGDQISNVTAKAIGAGCNESTPIAVVSKISIPGRKVVIGSLGDIQNLISDLETPVLIIIGQVIKKEIIDHYLNSIPRVLVTGSSAEKYDRYGLVTHTPLIGLRPLDDFTETEAIIDSVQLFDMIIFTSKYGVKYFFDQLYKRKKDVRALSDSLILSIGSNTSSELRKHGILADMQPEDESSEGIIDFFKTRHFQNKNILIPRSNLGLPLLPKGLSDLGNTVTVLDIYKNEIPTDVQKVNLSDFNYVTFSSPSCVDNFCTLYKEIPVSLKFIVKGNETRKKLTEKGLTEYQENEVINYQSHI